MTNGKELKAIRSGNGWSKVDKNEKDRGCHSFSRGSHSQGMGRNLGPADEKTTAFHGPARPGLGLDHYPYSNSLISILVIISSIRAIEFTFKL